MPTVDSASAATMARVRTDDRLGIDGIWDIDEFHEPDYVGGITAQRCVTMAGSEQDTDSHPGILQAADAAGESLPGTHDTGTADQPSGIPASDSTHAGELTATSDQHAGDDLLGVVTTLSSTVNMDHVLDQLTTSVDLFDLPTLDFGGSGSDPGDHIGSA